MGQCPSSGIFKLFVVVSQNAHGDRKKPGHEELTREQDGDSTDDTVEGLYSEVDKTLNNLRNHRKCIGPTTS